MRYFRILTDDSRFANRWFLDEPLGASGEEIDAREFTYGVRYAGPLPVSVPIDQPGRATAFNMAAFDMPVVTEEIARLVVSMGPQEVECFPVTIGSLLPGYTILNAVCLETCVDETRSEIMRWKHEDGRPDKVGRYRMVGNLTIDPTRVRNRHIFRIDDWEIALIVSERLKIALEAIPELGVVFSPV